MKTKLFLLLSACLLLSAPLARAVNPAGYAIDFDGVNDYVSVPLASPPANNYTISAWVYLRAGGTWGGTRMALLSSTTCGGSVEFMIRSDATLADPQYLELGRCGVFNGTRSAAPVALNTWVHLAVTVGADKSVTYYINGLPAGAWSATGLDVSLGSTVNLGDNSGTRRFNGQLDEVQIWSRVLSQAEIQSNMNHGLLGNEPGLYAYFRCDEGILNTTADSAPAGGLANGTLINGPTWVASGVTPFALAPAVTTLAPTGISNASVTLNASVNPLGQPTRTWFEWGNTTNYGYATTGGALPPDTNATNVVEALNTPTAGVIYHVRAAASNAVGTVFGQDAAFWSPFLALNGTNPLTNECHVALADPGATANASPLAFGAGSFHSLALRADRSVAAWGDNTYQQLNVPGGVNDFFAISAGSYHSLAIRSNRTVLAWGRNNNSQCNVPGDATNIVSVAGGLEHSVAARGDGSVLAWGNFTHNQTVIPAGATNVIAVEAGEYHNLALRSNRTVVAWGAGTVNNPGGFVDYGQSIVPANATNVIAISAGAYHSLVLRADGSVVAWGAGTTVNPGDLESYGQCIVPPGATNVIALAAGGQHSLALRADGTLVGWGRNDQGQFTFPAGATNIVRIAAGFNWSLALRADGEFYGSGLPSGYDRTAFPATVTNLTLTITRTATVDTNTPGSYTVAYAATNALGGYGTATRTVVVKDRTPPVITLAGANPLYWTLGVPFVDPGAAANDACQGNVNASIIVTGAVNVSIVGTNTLTYQAGDSTGNSLTTNRLVIVTSPPSLSGFTAQVIGTNAISGSRTILLSASVNPNGLAGVAWFQYGLNPGYPGATPATSFAAGFATQPRSATISNLLTGVTYHYRAVATNTLGLVAGSDQTFYVPTDFPVGDLNGDGIVDQSELNTVYGNFVTNSPFMLMTNVAGLGGTNVTFALSNSPSGNFTVEYSVNLVDWLPLGSAAPRYLFTDTNAPAGPQRFYRLRFP